MMMATSRLDEAATSLYQSIEGAGILIHANFKDKEINYLFLDATPAEQANFLRLIKGGKWGGWPVKIKGAK